jgi:hypothetical protein
MHLGRLILVLLLISKNITHICRIFKMKILHVLCILIILFSLNLFSQQRTPQNHSRGMLHQTVFNTGEVGRAYDGGNTGMIDGYSSMEWPPNSTITIDRTKYAGQHNSMGGGFWIAGTRAGIRWTDPCGAVAAASNGTTVPVAGVYCNPGSIVKTENYPLLSNGKVNLAYNPNEAEEIITSDWTTIGLNVAVKRISRAWSYPGYNSFIIYEYDVVNNDTLNYTDAFIGWGYGFTPSMFGYQRQYNEWNESVDMRQRDMYARFDFKRWMSYNHDRTGKPEANTSFFDTWSQAGDRGGLNSPQAVGIFPLYYDTTSLALKGQTNYTKSSDSNYVWDSHLHLKQPFTLRYENRNVDITKIITYTDVVTRKTGPLGGSTDSISYNSGAESPEITKNWVYWKGRAKPSWTLGWKQPMFHTYVFGPYTLKPGVHVKFALAEVVGYGAGVASDSVYYDLGGGIETAGSTSINGCHKIPSWYNEQSFATAGSPIPIMGSTYLQNHPLPWYVTSGVVSIRDVADRAIQMYRGAPSVVKYDSIQYEPLLSPATGKYDAVSIPVPAPIFYVENTRQAANKITWSAGAEQFTNPKLHAPFHHYEVYRALSALGQWELMDTVYVRDPRFNKWRAADSLARAIFGVDSIYVTYDNYSNISEDVYYAILSVDILGGKSGFTNIVGHNTQAPAMLSLEKVYVVPNPLIVTNGIARGSSASGEFTDKIGFFGLTKKCTIKVFSYSGALVQTFEHDTPPTAGYSQEWFQISRNNQMIASGVYFFVVQDAATGKRVTGKFVIIH